MRNNSFAITLILHALPCGNTLLVGVATAAHLCEVICGVQHPRGGCVGGQHALLPGGAVQHCLLQQGFIHHVQFPRAAGFVQHQHITGCASAAARFLFCKRG